ncbi:DUF5331 domain-containing protein [Argonema antarcticum]|uniref:DUF5331 domain-containing protein n=1 Tax=Argonema antarcticum TaxID=2942763 RepID=UPI0020132408|nr:DUF5331 domain-containing protein [Argonema antarcticum A004/B2]
MAFFDDFTAALRQKWLQYYQVNHAWLALQMELEAVKTPDGGRRPPSHLILGILNALEPKLAQLMLPFARLNPSPDALIEVLELNIDPDIALGNKPASKPEPLPAPSIVTPPVVAPIEDAFDEEEESLVEPVMVVSQTTVELSEGEIDDLDDEPSIVLIESETESFGDIALDEFGDSSSEESVEEDEGFGGIALDEFGDSSDEVSVEEDEGFGDIALDEFGETASVSEELSGEEDESFGDITLDEFADNSSDEPRVESDADFGTDLEAWGDESPEELEVDLGDMTLDEFGDTSSKELEEDDLDAFGDISFDPFGEPAAKSDDDDDAWSK